MAELRGGKIVIAGALVPQCLVDQNEVGRRPQRRELPRRGHADQQLASTGEQLLRNQHGEGCADGATDDAQFEIAFAAAMQVRVVARPTGIEPRSPGALQLSHEVAVRIENAYGRHGL